MISFSTSRQIPFAPCAAVLPVVTEEEDVLSIGSSVGGVAGSNGEGDMTDAGVCGSDDGRGDGRGDWGDGDGDGDGGNGDSGCDEEELRMACFSRSTRDTAMSQEDFAK